MRVKRSWIFVGMLTLILGGCASQNNNSSSPKAGTPTGPAATSVSVSPTAASVGILAKQQFTATVNGQASSAVTWEVNGTAGGSQQAGFISATGLYVAPAAVPTKPDGTGGSTTDGATISVTAVSTVTPTVSGSAAVTVLPPNENTQSGGVQLGTSGGNAKDSITNGNKITCCGGTLGALIQRDGTQFLLSANHVLARSDAAAIGDAIIQPGLIDTSTCTSSGATTVGNLSAFFNMQTGAAPKIDAAIAQVVAGKVDGSGNILLLGDHPDSNGVPAAGAPEAGFGITANGGLVGREVAKSGRSTGLTCAAVGAVDTLTSVSYTPNCDGSGMKFTVEFANQVDVLGGSFSASGDSGALIVTSDKAEPVALLYAGSDTDTVGNPVADVLNFFASGGKTPSFVGGGTHAVIGCTLPNKPASAATAASAASTEDQQRALVVRDAHAPELLAHPEVQALGVGRSYDNPHEPAILFFVTKGQARTNIPAQVEGVRTRIVEGELFARRGAVSAEESAALERAVTAPQQMYSISQGEYQRAKVVHSAHAREQMNRAGVQGVGITSSVDSPGEAALMIFLIRGTPHDAIPPMIDGLRTRVRESSRFMAGAGETRAQAACSVPVPKTATSKKNTP